MRSRRAPSKRLVCHHRVSPNDVAEALALCQRPSDHIDTVAAMRREAAHRMASTGVGNLGGVLLVGLGVVVALVIPVIDPREPRHPVASFFVYSLMGGGSLWVLNGLILLIRAGWTRATARVVRFPRSPEQAAQRFYAAGLRDASIRDVRLGTHRGIDGALHLFSRTVLKRLKAEVEREKLEATWSALRT